MLGKIEGRRRRGQQDEMVGWHHRLNGHGFGWTLGVGDGQGGLACCDSWGHKESDTTEGTVLKLRLRGRVGGRRENWIKAFKFDPNCSKFQLLINEIISLFFSL